MSKENYQDIFSDWFDVQVAFRTDESEPERVIFAQYDVDGYDGSAWVIYRNGDKIYAVSGGHCSCYGLEGQWDPEEYTAEQFVAAYEKGSWYRDLPQNVIDEIKSYMENKYNGA
jgi:hypothetical protein